jgi:hypothetical protein
LFSRVIGATSAASNVATIIPWTYVCKNMFHDATWMKRDSFYLHLHLFDYVVVDTRLSQTPPADGYLFDNEKGNLYSKPLPKEDLTKFKQSPFLQEVWHNKYVVIYYNTASRWPIPNILTPILQPF